MNTGFRKSFMISAVLLLLISIIAMTYFSGEIKNAVSGNESATIKQFVCSMHPEVIKAEPGDCPICGMSLVEKIDYVSLPSKKEFVCSMHPEVIKAEPGDCPICGMSLIEKIDQVSLISKKEYVCSMHPEVLKADPGDCPICGMSLIEKIDQLSLISSKEYVCSMHPEVIRDEPGDCSVCGMSLIIKIKQDMNVADSMLVDVVLPVNASVLGSVATVSPFRAEFPVTIEASGIINYDSRKIRTICAHFGGLIEKSFVKYQFQPIRKGQKIYQIYCPDIYTEKWNYVKLIQAYPDRDDLTVEAHGWLRTLGLTSDQINSLKRSAQPDYHLFVYSDADGYAVSADFDPEKYFSTEINETNSGSAQAAFGSLGINDGVTVEAGSPLFKVVDIKSLRADLKVRTVDVGLIRKGQKVNFTISGSKSQKIEAYVSQIEPLNGGLFQLVKVYFNDNEGLILPGTQIHAQIMTGNHESMWLPVSAVVNLGKRQTVFAMKGTKFIPVTINTGLRFGEYIEVRSGIDLDFEIALNALLLTDSDGFIHANSN